MLLRHGANIDFQNQEGETALDFAIGQDWEEDIITQMRQASTTTPIQHVASKAETPESHRDSFLQAVEEGRLDDVQRLLGKESILVDSADECGCTPLMYATGHGHVDLVRYLLDEDANVDATDYARMTALMFAATMGHINVAKLLLDRNASIENTDNGRWTALKYAAFNGNADITRLLLDRNANIEATTVAKII